jgi:7-carboxy-7-deazaguanine synthase
MFGTNEIIGKKFFKDAPKDSLFVTSMFFTLQGEGPYAGMPALFIRLAKCNLNCSFCFVPSTKITMANGKTKRIDQIKIGDEVMSWDKDKMVTKKVTRTYTSVADKLVKVNSSGESVWCTPEHPFLTSNRGWINAEDLVAGDKIVHWSFREKVAEFIHNGKVVRNVEFVNPTDGRGWARLYGSKTAERIVHNFEVEDTHTYIANGCVVHNCDTFFDDGEWMTFDEIFSRADDTIREYWIKQGKTMPHWAKNNDSRHVYPNIVLVITGGEPLLQENIGPFLNIASKLFGKTQIESNGIPDTVVPECTTLVCSPKCGEKDGKPTKYLKPSKTILERADCLKFVISADEDSPYFNIPEWAHEWKKERQREIYISPMNIYNSYPQKIKLLRSEKQGNITLEERSTIDEVINFFEPGLLNTEQIAKNHQYAAKYCMTHGFKLNLQMHLYASLA